MILLCIFGVLNILQSALAVRCFQCPELQVPLGCNTVVECASGEQCYIRQFVNPTGLILYDMGCLSSQNCIYKKRSDHNIVTCQRCCRDNYCNLEGCGSNLGALTMRGPKCFSCPTSVTPESCRQTQNCELDEECGLIHGTAPGDSIVTWKGRCIAKAQCDAINSITSHPGCNVCCTGDLCNDRCRNTTAPMGPTAVVPGVGIKCLQCSDVPHPLECNLVKTCPADEQCFVEEYVTDAGAVRFATGCASKQRCSNWQGDSSLKRDNRIVVCTDCCSGNFCNIRGCGSTAKPRNNRGPKCFDCPAQSDPDDCRDTTACAMGEVCALFKSSSAVAVWRSSCMMKLQCDAVKRITLFGKRRTTSSHECVLCCDDDFCNANCQNSSHVTPSSGVGKRRLGSSSFAQSIVAEDSI